MQNAKRPRVTAAFCFLALAAALSAQVPPTLVVFEGQVHEGTVLGTLLLKETSAAGVRYWFVPGDQVARLDGAGLQLRAGVDVDLVSAPAGIALSDEGAIAAAMGGASGPAVRRERPPDVLRGLLGEAQTLENQRQLVPFIRLRIGTNIAAIPAELLAISQP
jgi:hypothetical protein